MTFHPDETAGSIHIINDFVYADKAARLAATGFTTEDIGKVAKQSNNSSFHVLTTTTPTWMSITGGGVDEAPIDGKRYARKDGDWEEVADLGYVLATWGANLQNTGRHPIINGPSNAGEVGSLGIDASAPVPAAGTIDTITYYNSTGDNTTEFQIIKNGAVMYTFTCTGPYGVETGINVPTGFVGGVPDNIAIRYSSGTAPGAGFYSMYIS